MLSHEYDHCLNSLVHISQFLFGFSCVCSPFMVASNSFSNAVSKVWRPASMPWSQPGSHWRLSSVQICSLSWAWRTNGALMTSTMRSVNFSRSAGRIDTVARSQCPGSEYYFLCGITWGWLPGSQGFSSIWLDEILLDFAADLVSDRFWYLQQFKNSLIDNIS